MDNVNDAESGIVIFSCNTNLKCLCNEMCDIFIDGTFKYCPKFFFQLYSIHGCKNGNYIPLVFALLPLKTEECYNKMWDLLRHFRLVLHENITIPDSASLTNVKLSFLLVCKYNPSKAS
jgi:hypothetical protein